MWGMVKSEIEAYTRHMIWLATRAGKKPTEKTMADIQSKFSIAMKKAQSVGQNKAAAKLIISLLQKKKVPIIQVAPSDRERAFKEDNDKKTIRLDPRFLKKPTKTTAEQFQQLCGFTGVSSEHSRDAATLILNETIAGCLAKIQMESHGERHQPKNKPSSSNNNYYLVSRAAKDEELF